MESFSRTPRFCFNTDPSSNNEEEQEGEIEFSGVLEIFVHHARNIHNICIYANQDVYAKFSLTYNPDETISTRVINGGGKNPDFNERLHMKVTQFDAVLKCEIWMFSRAKNLMQDQLLGFALVPICTLFGKEKVTQEFSLTSTDLFHSPAGTVQLSLCLNSTHIRRDSIFSIEPNSSLSSNPSISSEVVLMDRKDPVEFSKIEFPDMDAARENQQMVSQYFNSNLVNPHGSFFHLLNRKEDDHDRDYDMIADSCDKNGDESGIVCSTTTSLSDDRNNNSSTSPHTPTSNKASTELKENPDHLSNVNDEMGKEKGPDSMKLGRVFSGSLGGLAMEAEQQSAMQQQIVDMYMKSMQQFTESLGKMKLPLDMDHNKPDGNQNHANSMLENRKRLEADDAKKKEGSRVFYGSRAFF